MSSLVDIAFPYRRRHSFGAASFAFTFLVLLFEVELLAAIGVAIATRQLQLWWDLQPIVLPTACLVSLATSAVFWLCESTAFGSSGGTPVSCGSVSWTWPWRTTWPSSRWCPW